MLSNLLWRIRGELPLLQTSGKTSWYFYGIFIHMHKQNMYIYIYVYMYNLILSGHLDRYLPLLCVYNPINNGIFSMSMSSCFFDWGFAQSPFQPWWTLACHQWCASNIQVSCALGCFLGLLFCCFFFVVCCWLLLLGLLLCSCCFFVSCWFLIVGCCFV